MQRMAAKTSQLFTCVCPPFMWVFTTENLTLTQLIPDYALRRDTQVKRLILTEREIRIPADGVYI